MSLNGATRAPKSTAVRWSPGHRSAPRAPPFPPPRHLLNPVTNPRTREPVAVTMQLSEGERSQVNLGKEVEQKEDSSTVVQSNAESEEEEMWRHLPTPSSAAPEMAKASRLHPLEATPGALFLPDPAHLLGPPLALHATISRRLCPPSVMEDTPGPPHRLYSHKPALRQ